MIRFSYLLIVLSCVAGCAGGGSVTPTAPTAQVVTPVPVPVPAGPPTITISATGMTPLEITIDVGQRVTFVNTDVRAHDVVGGVDPNHPDCPEIAQAGFLSAGQRGCAIAAAPART